MKRSRISTLVAVGLFVPACGLIPPWEPIEDFGDGGETGGERSYFLGEQMDYSAETICQNTDLNDVTSDFKQTLDANQWHGLQRQDNQSRMSDFYDQEINPMGYGKDHLFADAARVTVFAGHGHIGVHTWGELDPDPEINDCRVLTDSYALGTRSGDQSALFINAASCGGALSTDPDDPMRCFRQAWQTAEFRQWLGFIDSPHVDSWALSTFYQSLNSDPQGGDGHVDVWIDVMEWPEAGVHNYPVIYTKSDDYEFQSGQDELIHYELNMRSYRHMNNNPEPKTHISMSPTVGDDQDELAQMCSVGGIPC